MLSEVPGNILSGKYQWIIHQVNCKGVMNAGLARQIREKYPFVYQDYVKAIRHEGAKLGHIVISREQGVNGHEIISMLAQDDYGYGHRYTDYDAFKECLRLALEHINQWSYKFHENFKVGIPYKIGCGLGGGDWYKVKQLIKDFAKECKFDVEIVRLNR